MSSVAVFEVAIWVKSMYPILLNHDSKA